MTTDETPEFDEGVPGPGDLDLDALMAQLEASPDFTDEALADRDGVTPMNPQLTVNWRTITEEERPEACRTLAAWVHEWLIPRYGIKAKRIPDCWWQHTDLIEELSALHTAWQVAFDAADAGWGPIGWHERFAAALTREAFRERCVNEHRDDPKRSMPLPPATF